MKLPLTFVLLALAPLAHAFESPAAYSARLASFCVWAPRNPAICEGRNFCKRNVRSARCAQYCHVNPYDVVCGDVYRHDDERPGNGDPYPWAPLPTYCDVQPNDIHCQ